MCAKVLKYWTPKTVNFPFFPNGKLMVLGVPIFKHFRVGVKNIQLGTLQLYLAVSIDFEYANGEKSSALRQSG